MSITTADRLYGKNDLEIVKDFGNVLIGGLYWKKGQRYQVESAPLRLAISKNSGLIQLADLYNAKNYANYTFSGEGSSEYNTYLKEVADFLITKIDQGSKIFEIGASDGVLLEILQDNGFKTSGIEPSEALVNRALKKRVDMSKGFFNKTTARNILKAKGEFDVVILRHVIEHLDFPNEIFDAIDIICPTGILLMECPDIIYILENRLYSSIFHEHVAYYSLPVLDNFLKKRNWNISHYDKVRIHGSSHRIIADRGSSTFVCQQRDVKGELSEFVKDFDFYSEQFKGLVDSEYALGSRIGVYGCSHRTSYLMSYGGLSEKTVTAAFDSNKLLHGLLLPPFGVEIEDPRAISKSKVDTIVIAAISYADEILESLKTFRRQGGRVINAKDLRVY